MIALLVFGLIAAVGVALLSFSVRAQSATGAKMERANALARTGSALTGDLAQAVDRPARDAAGTVRPAFVGTAQAIEFTRAGWDNPDGAARSSLQKVAWRIEGGVLERQGWPMVDGAEPLPAAAMLDRVRSVVLRYRVAGAWTDRFDGAADRPLPQAVELRIVREDGIAYRQLFLVGSQFPPRPVTPPDA